MCINSKHEIRFTEGERVRIMLSLQSFQKELRFFESCESNLALPKEKGPCTIIVRSLEVQKSILSAITKKGIDSTFAPGQTELWVQL